MKFPQLKFIHSEKATKFCKIFTLLLSVCTTLVEDFAKFSGLLRIYKLYDQTSGPTTSHRGAFCQFSLRWIYYCPNSKSTGKETGKTHLCASRGFIEVQNCRIWCLTAKESFGSTFVPPSLVNWRAVHSCLLRPLDSGEETETIAVLSVRKQLT